MQNTKAVGAADTKLSAAERSVLSQESALKAAAGGAKTATTYKYEIGPDGKRYIVGAEVSITGTEEQLNSVPGGTTQKSADQTQTKASETTEPTEPAEPKDDPQVQAAIAELKSIEREVVAHEAAHMAAGGQFAGGVSYTYTTGPDGKKYITGGEVPIHMPATDDPEEALQNAEQIMRAALAPGNPSGQDLSVAANAAQIAAEARAKIASGEGGESNGTIDAYTAQKAKDAYSAASSKNGLWIAESAGGDRAISTIADDSRAAA